MYQIVFEFETTGMCCQAASYYEVNTWNKTIYVQRISGLLIFVCQFEFCKLLCFLGHIVWKSAGFSTILENVMCQLCKLCGLKQPAKKNVS